MDSIGFTPSEVAQFLGISVDVVLSYSAELQIAAVEHISVPDMFLLAWRQHEDRLHEEHLPAVLNLFYHLWMKYAEVQERWKFTDMEPFLEDKDLTYRGLQKAFFKCNKFNKDLLKDEEVHFLSFMFLRYVLAEVVTSVCFHRLQKLLFLGQLWTAQEQTCATDVTLASPLHSLQPQSRIHNQLQEIHSLQPQSRIPMHCHSQLQEIHSLQPQSRIPMHCHSQLQETHSPQFPRMLLHCLSQLQPQFMRSQHQLSQLQSLLLQHRNIKLWW